MNVFAAAASATGTLCAEIIASLASPACVALIAASIAACAGSGDGLDANGRPLAPGGTAPVPLSADFDSIQANIFTPICSVCHIGGGAPEGLRLDAPHSFNLLIGVPSTEVPALDRVKPGNPNNSYIIQKLEGHAAVGAQMPLGGPYLSSTTIGFIRQWITDGAPPSAIHTAHAAKNFVIDSIVPDNAERVSESPPQIMIAFNHDLDISQIDALSVHIERLMPGASLAAAQTIPARVTVSSVNLKVLMVWPGRQLDAGHYRLAVDSASPSQFSDLAGQTVSVGTQNEFGEFVISTFDIEVLP
ncbi:MAG: hypothetical protein M3O26_19525 [Pseudomonadota bacterium]|nr:hypothetical protein [Pseudomonadota bacterium]